MDRLYFVPIDLKQNGIAIKRDAVQVQHCFSKGHFCQLKFNNGEKFDFQDCIQYFDKLVAERGYIRIHQSHIVELEKIVRIAYEKAWLENGDDVPVSRLIQDWLKNYLAQKHNPKKEDNLPPIPPFD